MARRFYLAPVIGTGTEADPYRAKVPPGTNHAALIRVLPNGTIVLPWCIVRVARAVDDFTDIDADTDLDGWPLFPLDTRVNQLSVTQRNRLRTALERRGIDTSDVAGTTTLRTILRRVAKLLQPDATEATFDVSE